MGVPMRCLIGSAKLDALLALLASVRALSGSVVELGVYQGGSLAAMAAAAPERQVYGFDTFKGLPTERWADTDPHKPGEFGDVDMEATAAAMPGNVRLVAGLFPESAVEPEGGICLAHVDMDFERSTADAIAWLRPRMVSGGVVVFDDYRWKNCPGVEVAIAAACLPVVESAPFQAYWRAP